MWDLTIYPLRGPASSLALIPFSNRCGTPNPPPLGPTSLLLHCLMSIPFGAQPPCDGDLTIHLPSRPNVLTDTFSNWCGTPILLRAMWDLIIYSLSRPASSLALIPFSIDVGLSILPPSEASVLVGTLPHVHSLWGSASLLAYHLVSDFDTICNSPRAPPIDIVLFGFFVSHFPLKIFKMSC